MRVRGERECGDCGTRWSYYETGAIACPDCGSIRSVGVDDRTEHTDGAADLDLDAARAALAGGTGAYDEAVADLRAYLRRRGYVDAGRLHAPDDEQLVVAELRATQRAPLAGYVDPISVTAEGFARELGVEDTDWQHRDGHAGG